jgi:D-alanyl-D-alanine carboxypeptidase
MKTTAAVLALAAPLALAAQSPRYAAERARIDSMLGAEMAAKQFAGVAIAVVKGRDTIAMKAYGFADIENDVPATPEHVFRVGSVTKQFTSAAIMQLVEQGKLRLDDTLGAMLPNMPAAWGPVTLRQLLNHTSGIPSYTSLGPKWIRRSREDMLPDTIVAMVARDTMDFAPGSRYRYNNTGYVLLGMIVERASGQPYPRYLQEKVYAPAGISETSFCYTTPIIKRRAHGYSRAAGQFVNADFLSMTQPYAAGSLCSTLRDLLVWNQALHSGRVVSPASFAAMTTPVPGAAAGARYGFGLAADTLLGHRRIQHSGGIHGFQTMLAHYPNDSLTVVVLSNSTPSPVGPVAGNLARIVLGLPLATPPAPRQPQ